MARFIADTNQTGFYYESGTYANSSGTLQWIGQVQDATIDENPNVIPVRYQGSNDRDVDQFVDGPLDYTGTLSYFPQDWKFLGFALGSIADGGSPSPYTHDIIGVNSDDGNAYTSGTNNPFISFGLEVSQEGATAGENFVRTLKGAMVNTFTLNAAQGEIISCDVDFVAQSSTFSSGALTALSATTTRPFLWSDMRFHLTSGTVLNELKTLTFTINNNLQPPHYINGSREVAAPIPLNRDYELSITVDATSEFTKELYDQYFMGGSTFNSLLEINASTGSRDMFISMSGCKITNMDAPNPVEGVDEQNITIQPKTATVTVNDAIEKYEPF